MQKRGMTWADERNDPLFFKLAAGITMHPETKQALAKLYQRAANGDGNAYAFLQSFDQYFRDITAFAENPSKQSSDFIQLLARTNTVYSLPFYAANAGFLYLTVQRAIETFADGLKWRDHAETWKAQWSEQSRFALSQVVLAVATLRDMRGLGPELIELMRAE
jgi:hypothetical protein